MDRRKAVNGFTMAEMLMVLLIITIVTGVFAGIKPPSSLRIVCMQIQSYSILMQEQAFAGKERKDVRIETDHAIFDTIRMDFPPDIVCDAAAFSYNENGNISKAHTVNCADSNRQMKLVYQLGSGRVRIE